MIRGVLYERNGTLFVVKDFSDLIQKHIATIGIWEPDLVDLLKSISNQINEKKGKCHLVNIGAHIGTVCIACANHFSRITAFEPVKSTFDHLNLHRTLNEITHMKTYNVALSDSHHKAKIVFNTKNTGGCHIVSDYEVKNNIRHAQNYIINENVNCVPMDSIDFEDTIDVLLVDIEGHDEKFIQGAEQTIKKHLPILIMEIWTDSKRKYENMNTTQSETIQRIVSLGYKTVKKINHDTFIFL